MSTLTAGREMDMLVAEKVFGWTRHEAEGPLVLRAEGMGGATESDLGGSVYFTTPDGKPRYLRGVWPYGKSIEVPHFSTDISAAWQVITALAGRGLGLEIATYPDGVADVWVLKRFSSEYFEHIHNTEADTAPEAICVAALAAVGVEARP